MQKRGPYTKFKKKKKYPPITPYKKKKNLFVNHNNNFLPFLFPLLFGHNPNNYLCNSKHHKKLANICVSIAVDTNLRVAHGDPIAVCGHAFAHVATYTHARHLRSGLCRYPHP